MYDAVRGLKVAIVARDHPEDSGSTGFASPWAGCNWFPFSTEGDEVSTWDEITFRRLAKVAKDQPDLCEMIDFMSVWKTDKGPGAEPWFRRIVPGASEDRPLPNGNVFGNKFRSYIIHAPNYLASLGREVRSLGIPIVKDRLSSLDQAYNLPSIGRVSLVVNASGLGARSLIGVEDDKVYAARGQTVLVKAPGVKTCIMETEGFMAPAPKPGEKPAPEPAYIIPRPGPEGHVVLGGTYLKDRWDTTPDLKTAERILSDCFNLCPALALGGKSWRDIEVVGHNVGLRPAREGGPRMELERRTIGQAGGSTAAPRLTEEKGREVAVIHAYGIGSTGFLSSMGMAEKVSDLAVGYLRPRARL
ncbi:hypothetical protein IAU60_006352 [Kwoniella sp. DSM 27419]